MPRRRCSVSSRVLTDEEGSASEQVKHNTRQLRSTHSDKKSPRSSARSRPLSHILRTQGGAERRMGCWEQESVRGQFRARSCKMFSPGAPPSVHVARWSSGLERAAYQRPPPRRVRYSLLRVIVPLQGRRNRGKPHDRCQHHSPSKRRTSADAAASYPVAFLTDEEGSASEQVKHNTRQLRSIRTAIK